MWGQGREKHTPPQEMRIIPTRVGTRYVDEYSYDSIEDHPHACGDKKTGFIKLKKTAGSSPRVWGQGADVARSFQQPGIIPTRVGTSSCSVLTVYLDKDHPHACGDKF